MAYRTKHVRGRMAKAEKTRKTMQSKPKLLDLFCGATDTQKKLCHNKVWLKLNVCIVAMRLRQYAQIERSFALTDAVSDITFIYQVKEIARCAVKPSLSSVETKTDDIVLRHVVKRLIKSILCYGTNLILKLCLNITKHDWLRILVRGETSTETSDLKLSAYWGANV